MLRTHKKRNNKIDSLVFLLLKIKISNLPKKEFQSCPLNRKQMDKHSENSEMVTHLRCTEAPHRIYTELKNTLAGFNSRVDEVEE